MNGARKPLKGMLIAGLAVVVACAVTVVLLKGSRAGDGEGMISVSQNSGTVTAPDFPEGMQWLNSDHPLSLSDLRGKVVLLDFWTYCCINCMHIIPDLKRLESKYKDELVVIGVHSAKFTAERDTENIRQAILRYGIEHPVLNDRDMAVWREYGVRAWPTLVLIDPEGKVVTHMSGEGVYKAFEGPIAKVIATFDAKGEVDRRPLGLKLEREGAPASPLSFPGKVLADEAGGRLFISDSGHNRIVVISLSDGTLEEVIGSGKEGMADGRIEDATFNHPQGMAFDGRYLYIADTENHALRRVDMKGKKVITIAGTGQQAPGLSLSGPATETPLNSPWDLVLHEGALYVAMAGSHQIWRMDLKTDQVSPYAGSGREGRIDGPLASSALAQPSGITTDGSKLYFADSEDSSIRSADLRRGGRVETIVGGDLFDFGDRDGRGLEVRLQHPLGVAYQDGALYVADTYNNKVKRVGIKERTCETFLGTGKAGSGDGDKASFNEPGGLTLAHGKLYIADTNNHLIRVADLATRRVETLEIKTAKAPAKPASRTKPQPQVEAKATVSSGTSVVSAATSPSHQVVAPGEARLTVSLRLPEGYILDEGAPSSVSVTSSDEGILRLGENDGKQFSQSHFPFSLPLEAREGQAKVQINLTLYYCEEAKHSLCYLKEASVTLPVEVQKGVKNHQLSLDYELSPS